jgi:CRP/FNR family transcriptional regulator
MNSGLMMNNQDLNRIPLFEGLPENQLTDLGSIAVTKTFKRGNVIFNENEPGLGFYVVTSGKVKIFKLSSEGKEQILHIFGAGEPFGEAPVFEGKRFPAHAMALEDSEVLYFPRVAFIDLVKRNPSLAISMLAVLSKRLRRFAALVEDLSLREVPARLAAHLVFMSENTGSKNELSLDISKTQLAGLLGTIPETLSRVLTKIAKKGLIDIQGPNIRILDRQALVDLAQGINRL